MTSYGKEGNNISESHFASLSGSLVDLPAGPLSLLLAGIIERKQDMADQLTKLYVGLRGSAVLDGYGDEIESTHAEISVPVVQVCLCWRFKTTMVIVK